MPKILVAKRIADCGIELLKNTKDFSVQVLDDPTEEQFIQSLVDADAVLLFFRPLRAVHIEAARQLKLVSRHGVGYDAVDARALNDRGIPLTITASANATAVAEHAVALLLSVAHRTSLYNSDVRGGRWQSGARAPMFELTGKRALVVGAGRIGAATAKRLVGLEMQVACYDPLLPKGAIMPQGVQREHSLSKGLAEADVVSLHIPFSEQNKHLIDPGQMKKGAILINTARGGLVDETLLFSALKDGHLSGAGLDVFADEPPRKDHPLFTLENVALTPHSAALTDGGMRRMAMESSQNIIDFFAGSLNPACVVNKHVVQP